MRRHSGQLVRLFYHEVWNRRDEVLAHEILHPQIRFRGSLGAERIGVEGFLSYAREVHAALEDYHCELDELIEAGGKAAARLRFGGFHRGVFLGLAPTLKRVEWAGAAFFKTGGGRIEQVWVLGDLESLQAQLGGSG